MRAYSNKNSKEKIIYNGRFLKFIQKGEWEYIKRNNCTAIVIIVAMTRDRHVLFVEQYRPPVGKIAIEFPAGLVNDRGHRIKESMVTAAKRELLEETGYKAGRLIKLLEGPVSSGSCADLVTMYLAKNVQKISDGGGDDLESIIVHKIPIRQINRWLIKMKRKGCLVEPKIYAGLYLLNIYNK